jgi:hypothetical protein
MPVFRGEISAIAKRRFANSGSAEKPHPTMFSPRNITLLQPPRIAFGSTGAGTSPS